MGYRQSRRKYYNSAGIQAAQKHIDEAKSFSMGIGGTVSDVKEYFFNLTPYDLDIIFNDYTKKYGSSASSYAKSTYKKWKAGSTQMSGLVAKRLFDLLPPRMPTEKRLELAKKIWQHYSPRFETSFTVGPEADINIVVEAIQSRLEKASQSYKIPDRIKEQFDWLSAGDVKTKENLLTYFLDLEKQVAAAKLKIELPMLQKQISEFEHQTISSKIRVRIHRSSIDIHLDKRLGASFREGEPERFAGTTTSTVYAWIISISVVVLLFYMFSGSGKHH